MKKEYLVIGLKEVPIKDGYGDERNYIVSVHIGTFKDINEAEIEAEMHCHEYEHGIEVKTIFGIFKNKRYEPIYK